MNQSLRNIYYSLKISLASPYWVDLLILASGLAIALLGIGSYGFYEPHESHFAMVGQEMICRNDWIVPHLNGSPYLNKPPLLYWLIAISTYFFGSTEFSARLPVALAGWLGVVIAWKWARELWGIDSSRVCAIMLSVTLGWFIFTHQILIDVLLATLLLSSNFFFWRLFKQHRCWLNWWSAYISLALCVLAKGLIGLILPLAGCLALAAIERDGKIIQRIRLYRGLLLVTALVIPWFVAVEFANPGFLKYFIVNEHFDRLLDRRFPPDYEVSKIGAVGYLAITFGWCFPWVLFLPSVVKYSWQEWRQRYSQNTSLQVCHRSNGIFLLAIAAVMPVVMFLPFSSRLIYYGIPAIPAYVILCAGWWNKQYKMFSFRRWSLLTFTFNSRNVKLNDYLRKSDLYGVVALILGISFYSSIVIIAPSFDLLPTILQTREVVWLMLVVATALGTGWIAFGIGILNRAFFAWIPLFLALLIVYSATIRGFVLYQDLRSAKNMVQQINPCLNEDTLWTFEGSREIGAAGAIAYYLNQTAKVTADRNYRTVKILTDGGRNRIPPQFPNITPQYLISKAQLQAYWDSDRPVVFMTDFLRQANDPSDPILSNIPTGAKPYIRQEQRQLYLNHTASQLVRQCSFKN